MKEESRQFKKEIVERKTVYISNDGREFDDKEECEKWEQSAVALLFSKLKDCTIASDVDTTLDECDENHYNTLVPTIQEHLDTINQLYFMFGGKNKEGNYIPKVGTEDLHTPILFGYRFCCNEVDWVWFYKASAIVSAWTKDKYKLVPVE